MGLRHPIHDCTDRWSGCICELFICHLSLVSRHLSSVICEWFICELSICELSFVSCQFVICEWFICELSQLTTHKWQITKKKNCHLWVVHLWIVNLSFVICHLSFVICHLWVVSCDNSQLHHSQLTDDNWRMTSPPPCNTISLCGYVIIRVFLSLSQMTDDNWRMTNDKWQMTNSQMTIGSTLYGVATISRLLTITGLFCRI